jgi:hypothetical protein
MTDLRSGGCAAGPADPAGTPVDEKVSTTGVMGKRAVPPLFQDLHAEIKTTTIVLTRDRVVKKVMVVKGDIVFAASNPSEDRPGEC